MNELINEYIRITKKMVDNNINIKDVFKFLDNIIEEHCELGYKEHELYHTELKEKINTFISKKNFNNPNKFSKNNIKENKENNMKKNNYFSKDDSGIFKCSLMGVAAKVNDSYVIYNPENGVSDVTEFLIESNSLYRIPAVQVNKGDIILTSGNKPAYITNVVQNDQKTTIEIYSYYDNTINTYLPTKNILGMPIFTKIISIFDLMNVPNNISNNINGTQQINQLLPFMLLNNNSEETEIKDILMLNMMLGGNSQGLNPLLFLMKNDNNLQDVFPLMLLNQSNLNNFMFNNLENSSKNNTEV